MRRRKKEPRRSVAASAALTASALTISLCAAVIAPAYGWFSTNISSGFSSIQSATYTLKSWSKINSQTGESLGTPTTIGIAADSENYFLLTTEGTASNGYCTIGIGENTYYVQIPGGESVYLVVKAAAGTTITKPEAHWGTPPTDGSGKIVVAASSFAMEEDAPLMAYIEDSETPSTPYTVPERATLLAIAAHYGVEVEDILIYNGIDSIVPGDEILIPNPTTTVPYAPAGLYTVVKGDTLGIIAERFDVTVRSLCQWNNLPNENTLGVGMTLKIPIIYKPSTEDTTAVETTPVETTPVETTPVETTPAESTPVETTPEETTPVETTPVETTPVESTPEESTPAETTPTETTPEESTPAESTPAESTPEESTPAESTSEKSTSEETASKETASENAEQDDTVYVCGVPLYFQDDYPDTRYGNGTVKTSGCSVTSLTMVANAITGYDYTVDELADYFGGRAENNIARLETGSETLGLSFYKSENIHKTMEALEEGKIAIVLMDGTSNPNCLFTNSQHFIVLTGLNEEGKIMVNDSNPANYELWNLKNGFENGFEEKDILPGYSGAWVYDRKLETQPPRYSAPRVVKTEENRNYDGITLTEEERHLLACLIWGEARGECAEGQQAVAEVVFNRLESGQFGSTITDIICGEGQFNSVTAGQLEVAEPGQAQYQAIDHALYGKRILPTTICYFSVYAGNADVYIQVGNHLFSFTHS